MCKTSQIGLTTYSLKHCTCKTSIIGLHTYSSNQKRARLAKLVKPFRKEKLATCWDFEPKFQNVQTNSDFFFPIGKNDFVIFLHKNSCILSQLHTQDESLSKIRETLLALSTTIHHPHNKKNREPKKGQSQRFFCFKSKNFSHLNKKI